MMKEKVVIFDCERMKYPFTGLYEYCAQLSKNLVNNQENKNMRLAFYVPKKEVLFLGKEQNYFTQKSWHKFINPVFSKCDLWHGTYQGSMYYPKRKAVKKILTIHDLNFLIEKDKSTTKQSQYLKKLQSKIDRSDQLTVISKFTHDTLKENLNLSSIPVEVIYNGCDVDLADTPPSKPSFLDKEDKFLFSIGTIASKKNFHVLPRLLINNTFKLVIAGISQQEEYLNKIIAEAKKYNVLDRLILPGAVTKAEKWWLMKNTTAFLFPSLAEGFGIPVVEAMNFGIPVILSKFTCLPEIGGSAAYYFNSFDVEDMQTVLHDAIADFEINEDKKNKIKQRAAFFNWNDSAKSYLKLYNKWV